MLQYVKKPSLKRSLSYLVLPLAVCSCAMLPTNFQTSLSTPSDESEELAKDMVNWQEAETKLKRFSALENDLMMLMEELAKHSDLGERPDGFRVETRTELVAADEPYSPPSQTIVGDSATAKGIQGTQQSLTDSNAKAASAQTGTNADWLDSGESGPLAAGESESKQLPMVRYSISLGYFVSELSAKAASRQLLGKFDVSAYGLQMKLQPNANKRGQHLALLLEPFSSRAGAEAFCTVLKLHGHYCNTDVPRLDGATAKL